MPELCFLFLMHNFRQFRKNKKTNRTDNDGCDIKYIIINKKDAIKFFQSDECCCLERPRENVNSWLFGWCQECDRLLLQVPSVPDQWAASVGIRWPIRGQRCQAAWPQSQLPSAWPRLAATQPLPYLFCLDTFYAMTTPKLVYSIFLNLTNTNNRTMIAQSLLTSL